jgi:hypothetical protein
MVIFAAIVVVGFGPALRYLGFLPNLGSREPTMQWNLVRVSSDRMSAVIRVNECAEHFDGASAQRVGNDVRLTVFERAEQSSNRSRVDCAAFSSMPTETVQFGFALPPGGSVLASGCPPGDCADSNAS